MADLLPSRPDLDDSEKDPRVVGLDSDEVDDLLAAISSETAREILSTLHDEPGPPSDVADRIDTSIQNAQYHLDRLETAGLIEAAGTGYSEKGREMTVYAPSDQALVVVAGAEDESTGLESALTQLLGGVGAVALGSVVVDRLARTGAAPTPETADAGGGAVNASGTTEPTATSTPTPEDDGGGEIVEVTETPAPTEAPAATPTPEDDGGARIAEVTETPAPTEAPAATPTPAAEPTPTPEPSATETAADVAKAGTETAAATGGTDPITTAAATVAGLSPGELFFVGGVLALLSLLLLRVR